MPTDRTRRSAGRTPIGHMYETASSTNRANL